MFSIAMKITTAAMVLAALPGWMLKFGFLLVTGKVASEEEILEAADIPGAIQLAATMKIVNLNVHRERAGRPLLTIDEAAEINVEIGVEFFVELGMLKAEYHRRVVSAGPWRWHRVLVNAAPSEDELEAAIKNSKETS